MIHSTEIHSTASHFLLRMKAWLRKWVSRDKLDATDPRLKCIHQKTPHAKGALLFFHKGLGDLVLALPALQALQQLGPIRLFLADRRFIGLLGEHGFTRSEICPCGTLRMWLALLLGKFDYCVNFDSMYVSYATRIMMILAHAGINVGYLSGPLNGLIQLTPAEPAQGIFVGELFNNLARCLGASPEPASAAIRRNEEGPIVFHVGGRLDRTGFDKRWPIHKYIELAEQCADLGYPVTVLWGPGDPVPKAKPPIAVEYCSNTESLFKVLRAARLFVCNNTGVLWAACLTGVETVSFATPFFLPQWDPREYRREANHLLMDDPLCECTGYRCQKGNCLRDISVETAFHFIRGRVSALPAEAGLSP